MAKCLSISQREQIIFHKKAGETNKDIAKWVITTERSVRNVWKHYQETGNTEPLPKNAGRKPTTTSEQDEKIKAIFSEAPDTTYNEIIDKLGLNITQSGLSRKLKKWGYSFKKNFNS